MIVAAHQPLFISWIGYFDKINKADLFVIVDNVQFTSSGWIRRNTIKGPSGGQQIVVPIKKKKHIGQIIRNVFIDNDHDPNWREKHIKTFITNYGKASYFNEIIDHLRKIYVYEWEKINDFNMALIKFVCDYLDIKTKMVMGSEIDIHGSKTELIVDICEKTGADAFMLGMGGSTIYADREHIKSKGIDLVMQNFRHPVYPQLFGDFMPNLSILDLLFNMGPQSRNIIRNEIQIRFER